MKRRKSDFAVCPECLAVHQVTISGVFRIHRRLNRTTGIGLVRCNGSRRRVNYASAP